VTSKVNPKTAAARLRRASRLRPRLAIILGSGFRAVAEAMDADAAIPYSKLPGFPKPSVAGHRGEARIGKLGCAPVLVLNGRVHYYEGHSMATVTFPVRVLAAYGVESLLLTNAAGGINPNYRAGDFMLFKDHINLQPDNPLRGPQPKGLERFLDLTQVYDPAHSKTLHTAARADRAKLHAGTYLAVPGPNYETPAEIRAFKKLGADAVGMSTVPEALVARQHGLRVAALSCITNPAAGTSKQKLSHEDVLTTAAQAAKKATGLITNFAQHHD